MKIRNAEIRLVTDDILFFEEKGHGICHDIDAFVRDLKRQYGINNRRVICRDKNGHCDELIFKLNMFHCFAALDYDDPILVKIRTYLRGKK